jgi:hypothetical protein
VALVAVVVLGSWHPAADYLEADLDANRAFVIFFEHLSSDQSQIYESAQEIFEANRCRFETSASRNDEPSSDRSSVAD